MAGLSTGNGLPNAVVTGVAMSTALATDAESTWKKLLDGQSGIRTTSRSPSGSTDPQHFPKAPTGIRQLQHVYMTIIVPV
jgi:3-oxoacyl-(acyl-carrier-protein) synthase